MISSEQMEEINTMLQALESNHLSSGPICERVNAFKALVNLNRDESEAIYNLMETHSPGLRTKTVYRYEKTLSKETTSIEIASQLEVSKKSLATKCSTYPRQKKVDEMLRQIREMPKEWNVVQLTPQFNPQEIWNEDKFRYFTNSVYISVFTCGTDKKPFVVTAPAPRDVVNGQIIELSMEMWNITKLNKEALTSTNRRKFWNSKEKKDFYGNIQSVEDRLKLLIKDMQNLWLREWRCLLTGKFCDGNLETEIKMELKNFFQAKLPELEFTTKIETILCCIIKNYANLKLEEIKRAIEHCIPNVDKNTFICIGHIIRTVSLRLLNENSKEKQKRHPVILIIHDSLDPFPWEMMDVLKDQPACRLPSLHFLYCLFKEHEKDIVDGYKIIRDYENGTYVVNPNKDLNAMENRIMSFITYWTPKWKGWSGCQPPQDRLLELLMESEIFSYNGHGSGSCCIPTEKFEKTHIKAVVLLFGCSSNRIERMDPQADMFGPYHSYLIARCPCVVGMLWEVSDKAIDVLSTDFASYWIPSNAKAHWKYVDKQKWRKGEECVLHVKKPSTVLFEEELEEPDLLRALILTKKNSSDFMTRATCVARGLPVKIIKNVITQK